MSDGWSAADEKQVRVAFAFGYLAMLCATFAWIYAGHRYDALNIGGATGNVDLWIRVGDIGLGATLLVWLLCITAAWGAGWAGMIASWRERIVWGVLSVVSAPLMALGLFAVVNANVHATN